jgi:hypothetical protein
MLDADEPDPLGKAPQDRVEGGGGWIGRGPHGPQGTAATPRRNRSRPVHEALGRARGPERVTEKVEAGLAYLRRRGRMAQSRT